MTLHYGYANRTLVTAENIGEAKETLNAADQSKELEIGCEIWLIQHSGSIKGYFTAWPNGRGAVEFGGDSVWGDLVGEKLYTEDFNEDGNRIIYDADGEEVTMTVHTKASQCTVDPETNLCSECGVDHSEPCPTCGARAFHAEGCGQIIDVCLAGCPAINGVCGDPDCVCA